MSGPVLKKNSTLAEYTVNHLRPKVDYKYYSSFDLLMCWWHMIWDMTMQRKIVILRIWLHHSNKISTRVLLFSILLIVMHDQISCFNVDQNRASMKKNRFRLNTVCFFSMFLLFPFGEKRSRIMIQLGQIVMMCSYIFMYKCLYLQQKE